MDRTDIVVKFINEASQMGIRILPPDINESNYAFTVVGPNIRFGLGAVKGVGEGAIESILEARQRKGRYTSLLDFCEAVDLRACNKKVIEALIKSGSFDFLGTARKVLFDSLENTVDSAQRAREEKERGQSSLFGGANAGRTLSPAGRTGESDLRLKAAEWPDDEKLKFEKETLGFYITGHPLNKFTDELRQFANATTDSLHQHIDEIVNIGGMVSQLKKSKIKKGPNEGKLMAKFILDDQRGSVEVVVFSDLYSKYARWLDNGIAVLLTAAVKDTGGMQTGRSAALQSAEQNAQRADEEYAVSGYDVSEDDVDDDRDPKEIEAEKYGDRTNNLGLFAGVGSGELGEETLVLDEEDLARTADAPLPTADEESTFATHAASFHEAPITPELNALEIVPLEGIRDKKVKEIALEVPYPRMSEETVRRIREIVEEHQGEVPLTVTIIDLPQLLADSANRGQVRLKVNQHFRVQPGATLSAKLQQVHATAKYVF
jgi:predicted nucleic acid-binding OB-fold protein